VEQGGQHEAVRYLQLVRDGPTNAGGNSWRRMVGRARRSEGYLSGRVLLKISDGSDSARRVAELVGRCWPSMNNATTVKQRRPGISGLTSGCAGGLGSGTRDSRLAGSDAVVM